MLEAGNRAFNRLRNSNGMTGIMPGFVSVAEVPLAWLRAGLVIRPKTWHSPSPLSQGVEPEKVKELTAGELVSFIQSSPAFLSPFTGVSWS